MSDPRVMSRNESTAFETYSSMVRRAATFTCLDDESKRSSVDSTNGRVISRPAETLAMASVSRFKVDPIEHQEGIKRSNDRAESIGRVHFIAARRIQVNRATPASLSISNDSQRRHSRQPEADP